MIVLNDILNRLARVVFRNQTLQGLNQRRSDIRYTKKLINMKWVVQTICIRLSINVYV
jgi:hypothetical protein